MIKYLLLTLIFLSSTMAFSASALDPRNSKMEPLSFTHNGKEYHIGIWSNAVLGDTFAMVSDRGDGVYIFVGTFEKIRENDSEGDIERFGGVEAYLMRLLDSWNKELQKVEKVQYPGWADYIHNYVYLDESTGQLMLH